MSRQVQVEKREPSAEKVAMVARIAKLAKDYPVLAVTKLSKVRSAQLPCQIPTRVCVGSTQARRVQRGSNGEQAPVARAFCRRWKSSIARKS